MGIILKSLGTLLVATFAVLYQLYIKNYLLIGGVFPSRNIQSIGNKNCTPIKGVEACEKLVLYQPTGVVYMSCSFPVKRRQWTPALDRLDPDGYGSDYIAQYDPVKKQVIRMKFAGLEPNRLSALGFDVQTNPKNASETFFYIVHHRVPDRRKGHPRHIGAESVIQVFKGTSIMDVKGSSRLTFVKEYASDLMTTPNDVVGSPDGKSFWWTNDHGEAIGSWRNWEAPLQLPYSSIGYCHEDTGCKLAATGLKSSNGIASNGNGTIYVASMLGAIQSFEQQSDGTLVLGDTIRVDRPIDNIVISQDGAIIAGAFPIIGDVVKNFDNRDIKAASSALKITKAGGKESFFGKKYQVETIFEDDGTIMPPATSAVVDTERGLMYLHGITAPHLLICKI